MSLILWRDLQAFQKFLVGHSRARTSFQRMVGNENTSELWADSTNF